MLKIKSNNLSIHNFTIYAERHCGTKFLESYITESYHDLPITWDYGWKHWFGFSDQKILTKGQHTLFIGIVRDPYDWLMAFKRMPHHLRRWNGKMNENPFKDDFDFLASEVVSFHHGEELSCDCQYGSDHHIQECRRYKNIFELRETKNRYLLDTMTQISHNYILINYEILNTNIESLILTLNNNFNLNFNRFIPNISHKKSYAISKETRTFINNSLNWSIENSLGYSQIL